MCVYIYIYIYTHTHTRAREFETLIVFTETKVLGSRPPSHKLVRIPRQKYA